jgi:hypothetical protein
MADDERHSEGGMEAEVNPETPMTEKSVEENVSALSNNHLVNLAVARMSLISGLTCNLAGHIRGRRRVTKSRSISA